MTEKNSLFGLGKYQKMVSEIEASRLQSSPTEIPRLSRLVTNSYHGKINLLLWASLTALKANMLTILLKESVELQGVIHTRLLQKELIVGLMADILQHLALTADALNINLQDVIEKEAKKAFCSLESTSTNTEDGET